MSTEIDRLEVVFTANIQALEERLLKAVNANKKAAKDIESAWAGKGLFGAAEAGLTSLTEHIGEAAKSIPVFGAALGALGPVGVTAAVAVGGFALAMEQTEKAVDYAAGIGKLAATIGVSTDFIQKFNYAARQSEVDVGSADQALKALNASVGAVQGNLPRAKQLAVVFADALKITPEQLKSYHDLEDLFPLIADRIANAGSAAEKAAIAKKLGVEDLLPMLDKGAAGFAKMAGEAESLGVVMSESTIQKAEEAAAKLKALDDVMQAQKSATFVEYADTLIAVKTAFNQATLAALGFLAAITNTRPIQQQIDLLDASIASQKKLDHGHYGPATANLIKSEQAQRDALVKKRDEEDVKRYNEELKQADQGAPKGIVPPKPAKAGPKDQTVVDTKAANDAYTSTLKALTDAQAALTDNLDLRATLEKEAIDDERAKQIGDINAKIAKAKEDQAKGLDKTADAQIVQLEQAKINVEQLAVDKKMLVDKQRLADQLNVELAHQQAVADINASALQADADHLNALANLTNSTDDRAAYQTRALQEQQAAERILLDATLAEAKQRLADAERRGASDLKPLQDAVNKAQVARDQADQKQADAAKEQAKALETPLQKYVDGIGNLDTAMQDWAAGGLNDLATGFAKAVVEGGKLTDVAKSIFQKIAEDMVQAFIEQQVTKPTAALLSTLFTPHAAGDLTGSAGGLSLVGEKGPELVSLPGGSRVISNNSLRQIGMSGGGYGAPTIVFDNRGAVIWEQAARTMMAYADRAAASAGIGALQASRQAVPIELARASGRSLR
jgi:hypothetical protein